MPATPIMSSLVPLLLALILIAFLNFPVPSRYSSGNWTSWCRQTHRRGFHIYLPTWCVSLCCVQCSFCLYGVGLSLSHSKGFSTIKIQKNFSHTTCLFSSLFHPCEKLVKKLLAKLVTWLDAPSHHCLQPVRCYSSGFSISRRVTVSRKQDVSAGFFLRWCLSGGDRALHSSGSRNKVWHSQNGLKSLMDMSVGNGVLMPTISLVNFSVSHHICLYPIHKTHFFFSSFIKYT